MGRNQVGILVRLSTVGACHIAILKTTPDLYDNEENRDTAKRHEQSLPPSVSNGREKWIPISKGVDDRRETGCQGLLIMSRPTFEQTEIATDEDQ
jgi:hypothetical protein